MFYLDNKAVSDIIAFLNIREMQLRISRYAMRLVLRNDENVQL